jgi:hypothetical protein
MRTIGIEEWRARLAVRHHLATRAPGAAEAAAGVVALHGTDAASGYLSAAARMHAPERDEPAVPRRSRRPGTGDVCTPADVRRVFIHFAGVI